MKALLLFFALLIAMTSCAPTPSVSPAPPDFDTFLREVNDARKNNMAWKEEEKLDLGAYTPDFADDEPFTEEEMEQLVTPPERLGVISLEEALEDMDTFFRIMQTTYGCYDYFGGDAVFLPLCEQIKTELEGKRGINAEVLETVLIKYLSPIVVDSHFVVGKSSMAAKHRQYMYYVPDLYFDDTTGLDLAYVKPTIGLDGKLTYCFAALSDDGSNLPATAAVNGETIELSWAPARPGEYRIKLPYSQAEMNGIPILINRTLMRTDETAAALDELALSGGEYSGLPLLIVDIRGNGGGDSTYAHEWVCGFSGTEIQLKGTGAEKLSSLYLHVVRHQTSELSAMPLHLKAWLAFVQENLGTWNTFTFLDGKQAANNTLTLVLTDKQVGSSGESFVHYLRTLDNTVFIGSNTVGNYLSGNVCWLYLPYSGMYLQVGTKISMLETTENCEGIGILPDLWVNPTDAMDAVLRMCEYYDLTHAK